MSGLSMLDVVSVLVLAVLSALFLGYATGRRTGLYQGQRLGRAQAPLSLRRRALQEGQCPVCDRSLFIDSVADGVATDLQPAALTDKSSRE